MPWPVVLMKTDRPSRDRGRSTVVALTIGFVLSVTGFAFFTAWLIREA